MPDPESHVLVVFESQHGQSRKIAEYIAELARRAGHMARALHVSLAPRTPLASYTAAVVVAPVHYARHPRKMRRFLRRHADMLAKIPVAFVSVSNSAVASDARTRAEASRLAHELADEVALKPAVVATAGGALAYPRYNPLLRWVMRRIAAKAGAPTETSRTHELTIWSEIDAALVPFFEALPRPAPDATDAATRPRGRPSPGAVGDREAEHRSG